MKSRRTRSFITKLAITAALAVTTACAFGERARLVPPPAADESAVPGVKSEKIVLAGGCFWGVQGVFQHVKGVMSAVSGYAGGERSTADYQHVSSGDTGHAESVQVTFDPRVVSLGRILQIYFSVAHDPTQLNRQGPDSGTQYRSAIFTTNDTQAQLAKNYIAQLNAAHAFDAAIVTRVETGKSFFAAEGYHQDYMTRNPSSLYIMINDRPKVASLEELFPQSYRKVPVLVASAR